MHCVLVAHVLCCPPVWKNGYAEYWRLSYKSINQSIRVSSSIIVVHFHALQEQEKAELTAICEELMKELGDKQ